MPVATSSRRNTNSRRQNSEDIEDVRNTQVDGNIDDVSDEDRPRTATRKATVKKEKEQLRRSNGKQRADPEAEANQDADEDIEDDEDDRIDVHNLPDQPLRKDDMTKLKGLSTDWISMRDRISKKGDIFKEVGIAMAEAGEKDMATSKELQRLDRDMREFLDVAADMTAHGEALDALYQKVMAGQEIVDSLAQYTNGVEERKNEYASKTTRQKYVKKLEYAKFHSEIWDVNNPNNPMRPLTEMIPKEEGDDSDDDDDVEMGGVTQNFNCPITLTLLVDPYTSRICHHSFSGASIKDHFRSGPPIKKCPAAGCNQSFKLSDCQPDKQLAKSVANYVRHQAVNAEDSDAEEVID